TPFFLGGIAAAMIAGRINPEAITFYDGYIRPWFNWFSVAVGLFTVFFCGFLAAVYLIGDAREPDIKRIFVQRAKLLNVLTVLAGVLVFLAAEIEGLFLVVQMITDPVSLGMLILATASLIPLWYFLE